MIVAEAGPPSPLRSVVASSPREGDPEHLSGQAQLSVTRLLDQSRTALAAQQRQCEALQRQLNGQELAVAKEQQRVEALQSANAELQTRLALCEADLADATTQRDLLTAGEDGLAAAAAQETAREQLGTMAAELASARLEQEGARAELAAAAAREAQLRSQLEAAQAAVEAATAREADAAAEAHALRSDMETREVEAHRVAEEAAELLHWELVKRDANTLALEQTATAARIDAEAARRVAASAESRAVAAAARADELEASSVAAAITSGAVAAARVADAEARAAEAGARQKCVDVERAVEAAAALTATAMASAAADASELELEALHARVAAGGGAGTSSREEATTDGGITGEEQLGRYLGHISKLEQELADLKLDKVAMAQQLEAYASNEGVVQAALCEQELRFKLLQRQLAEVEHVRRQEIDGLHKQLLQVQQRCCELEGQLAESDAKHASTSAINHSMEAQLLQIQEALSERSQELATARSQLEISCSENVEQLRGENDGLRSDLIHSKMVLAQMHGQVMELEHQLSKLGGQAQGRS